MMYDTSCSVCIVYILILAKVSLLPTWCIVLLFKFLVTSSLSSLHYSTFAYIGNFILLEKKFFFVFIVIRIVNVKTLHLSLCISNI